MLEQVQKASLLIEVVADADQLPDQVAMPSIPSTGTDRHALDRMAHDVAEGPLRLFGDGHQPRVDLGGEADGDLVGELDRHFLEGWTEGR